MLNDRPDAGRATSGSEHGFSDRELPFLSHVARAALERWDFPSNSEIQLANLSENATYFIQPPDGESVVLRVGRPNYNTPAEVASELTWMEALRNDGAVRTPPVLRTKDGALLAEVTIPELSGTRACVMFRRVTGAAPSEDGDLSTQFRVLGGLAARIHEHGRAWEPPASFTRRRWSYATIIGAKPAWGRWQEARDVGAEERALFAEACARIKRRLDRYGTAPDRYGLVHADLRLGNTLLAGGEGGGEAYVIDFDDAGYSWLLWDLATALTFTEHRPEAADLVAAWIDGYLEIRPLSDEILTIASTLLVLRRLQVLAWLGSHAYSELAKQEGPTYVAATCQLVERYLADQR